jgi:hypothetical protein
MMTKSDIVIEGNDIILTFPRRVHNPIIKAAQLDKIPTPISWLRMETLEKKILIIPCGFALK